MAGRQEHVRRDSRKLVAERGDLPVVRHIRCCLDVLRVHETLAILSMTRPPLLLNPKTSAILSSPLPQGFNSPAFDTRRGPASGRAIEAPEKTSKTMERGPASQACING